MDITCRPLRDQPVLIIGAGITGLVLAQALKTRAIPFLIFERDAAADSRLQGWALTIHFCLPQLLSLLPDSIIEQLDSTLLDPGVEISSHDSVFLDLADGTVKWRFPLGPRSRKRVCRDKFRRLLLQDLTSYLRWGKRFVSFKVLGAGIRARFGDGTFYDGLLLVGADGSKSMLRSLMHGPAAMPLKYLPFTFLGTSTLVNHDQIGTLLDIHPILFQGFHPESHTWMWFSVMESPGSNGTLSSSPSEEQFWKIQICLSWPGEGNAREAICKTESLCANQQRLGLMLQKAGDFEPRLRSALEDILSPKCQVLDIRLFEWHLPLDTSNHSKGSATLAGDAAHTMAPYRGEGFNHAIVDVYKLVSAIDRIYDRSVPETESYIWKVREQAIAAYETEVSERGGSAVRKCHEACLEVHNLDGLDAECAADSQRA